ncbi:exodeoxyribonuclease VII large subunit [Adlercreutzia murintestinalis]|uniref:exodeoxyribonuclease VII large subunit n=1 Tax=Adlercreutzia murintestinalis TaxID=2941325 RepID=UPI00203F4334|nr:exodeoxyribonuclease VII large subunit [Adlercreutzia murintestinalis]
MEAHADHREPNDALSVSAALALAKGALEGVTVKLVGEISELSVNPRYKAVYFTVKDETASLPCMMWNNRYAASGVQLTIGAMVELSGRFTLYAAKGRMNFDVLSVALAGEGVLRLQVAQLAARLKAEGLFESARKRPIPTLPRRIGVVTSPRGAAVHDVLRTLRRRLPIADVVFAGVGVEGAKAPREMSEALYRVAEADVDVILLVRGGGSFEDLMPFNDEGLVRAIAQMPVPIVTGIGHEPDTSIADMAADLRASTPTAAAEAVSAQAESLTANLAAWRLRMQSALRHQIASLSARVSSCASRRLFQDPMSLLDADARVIDEMAARLGAVLPRQLERERARLAVAAAHLNDLSPLAVVARGYAIARDEDGHVISSVSQVQPGDRLDVTLRDGSVACAVAHATDKQLRS